MHFRELLEIVGDEPLFESGLLLAGPENSNDVRRQLVRWRDDGKLVQLRRGLYALAPPYAGARAHPFLVANRMDPGSYVSLQSALAFHGVIPEAVPVTTSVGSGRTRRRETPLGAFLHRHVRDSWIRGFDRLEVVEDQSVFVASPEKAILDLVYLEPGADQPGYLDALRLQHLDQLDAEELLRLAEVSGRPKLRRAAAVLTDRIVVESPAWETL